MANPKRANETDNQRAARHLSEIAFEHAPGNGITQVHVAESEGLFLLPVTGIRLDPHVGRSEFDSQNNMAKQGDLPLRESSQSQMDAFRDELVSLGLIKEADKGRIQLHVEGREQGESQYATMGGKGGIHAEITIAVPIEAVDAQRAVGLAVASRVLRDQQKTRFAVKEGILDKGIEPEKAVRALVGEMQKRGEVIELSHLVEDLLKDPAVRQYYEATRPKAKDATEPGTPGVEAKPKGWRARFDGNLPPTGGLPDHG